MQNRDVEPVQEAPTLDEIRRFAEQLPPDEASDLLHRVQPRPPLPTDDIGDDRPAPVYESWTSILRILRQKNGNSGVA